MTFSYSAIWDDSVRLLKARGSLLTAVAGVFLLLPELFVSYAYPRPQPETMQQMIEQMTHYFSVNWAPLLIAMLVSATGAIAMLLLLFDHGGLSVGAALRGALSLLVPYVLANFICNMLIVGGGFLFILPGLYLLGRLAPIGPIVAAEGRRNPLDALRRAFEVTKGNGWAVAGLVVVIFLTGTLVVFAISRVVGAILLLAGGPRIGGLLSLILDATLATALTTVTLVVYAAIYRRLTATPQPGVPRISGI